MAQLNLSNGIVINISQIKDKDCQFLSLETEEYIQGPLPKAKLVVKCDQDLVNILDQIEIKIDNKDGYSIIGRFYVYGITYLNNTCEISLMGYNPDFTRRINSGKFTDIKSAVNSLVPCDIIKNTDTDVINNIEIHQIKNSNYQLLVKILPGWKKDTIYGFSLDGLRIHDLSHFEVKWEDFIKKLNLKEVTPPQLTDPKLYSENVEIIDYSHGKDPNHKYLYFNKTYVPVNENYDQIVSNIIHNTRLTTTKNTSSVTTSILVPVNITDGIKAYDRDANINKIFIASRKIKLEHNNVQVDYTLKSINPI